MNLSPLYYIHVRTWFGRWRVVRDDGYWLATFRFEEDARRYTNRLNWFRE